MSHPDEPWTIGRLLAWTIDYFTERGVENPRLDAEILLASARGCQRIDLYAAYGDEATEKVRTTFRELVRRRAAGTPVAYLVGHREFYALDFEVTPDVLIPRPETELLVVALVDHMKKMGAGGWGLGTGEPGRPRPRTGEPASAGGGSLPEPPGGHDSATSLPPAPSPQPAAPSPHFCDVGTGSGVLAVCAAKYVPQARVTAIDVSTAALAVARRNAERHGVADRITFLESNLFAAVTADTRFDFILSNPPYVSTAEMAELPPEVRDHEPHAALHAGERGTEIIERLIAQSADRLRPGGVLIIEVSPMIAAAVESLVGSHSAFDVGRTLRDPAGHARVIQAMRR